MREMFTKSFTVKVFAIGLLVGCLGQRSRMRPITELAPPTDVQLVYREGQPVLTWTPSRHAESAIFAGYNLYVSAKSLLFASPEDLPAPVFVGAGREFTLSPFDSLTKVYLHLRSVDQEGAVGLPSLPEVVIER